jgi:hypothetical protein
MLEAGQIPAWPAPVHEHGGYLEDYRQYAHRKAFRVPEVPYG